MTPRQLIQRDAYRADLADLFARQSVWKTSALLEALEAKGHRAGRKTLYHRLRLLCRKRLIQRIGYGVYEANRKKAPQ